MIHSLQTLEHPSLTPALLIQLSTLTLKASFCLPLTEVKKVDFYDFVSISAQSEAVLKTLCAIAYKAVKVGGIVAVSASGLPPNLIAKKVRASGFVTEEGVSAVDGAVLTGTKPSFDGESVPLNIPTAKTLPADDNDIVDENDLLEPEDFVKPAGDELKGTIPLCWR
ncbi:hypothetical protein COOONC_27970, partial [Cooperia oncophora]